MLFDSLQISYRTESLHIFQGSVLERFKGVRQFLNIFIREIPVLAVNHIAHLTGINKQRFSFLLFVFANEPERNRNCHAIKQLRRQGNDAFHQIGVDNILSDLTFTGGLRRQCAVRKHQTNLAIRCKVVNHVLNPCVVGITGRRRSVLPANIILQFVLSPVRQIKRRVCHNEIRTKIGMKVIKERISLIRTEVCINATNRHIHLRHFPGIRIGFLTINGNALTIAAVCLDELHALHKHTAGAAARVINTAIIERLQDGNDCLNNTGRCVELAALHTFVSSELCDTILVSSAQKILTFLGIRHIHIGEQINDIT